MELNAAMVEGIVRQIIAQNGGVIAQSPKEEKKAEPGAIPVGVSNRHIHLTASDVEVLFGKGYELAPMKDLSQPGQFACKETLTIVGPSMRPIEKVRVLGPLRSKTQVEISRTDSYTLKVKAPVRESGDVAGSGSCKLVGPCGEVELAEGVIAAKRHIHMTPEDAANYGITDAQVVRVQINTEGRSLVFGDVVARVSPKYALAMHIDTDESNAAGIAGACTGIILD